MSHQLVEKTAGLASRVSNLVIHHTGQYCVQLMEAEDRLAKLLLAAIVKELKSEHEAYQAALQGLDEAIAYIGEAERAIDGIARAIRLTNKAIALLEKAVTTAV